MKITSTPKNYLYTIYILINIFIYLELERSTATLLLLSRLVVLLDRLLEGLFQRLDTGERFLRRRLDRSREGVILPRAVLRPPRLVVRRAESRARHRQRFRAIQRIDFRLQGEPFLVSVQRSFLQVTLVTLVVIVIIIVTVIIVHLDAETKLGREQRLDEDGIGRLLRLHGLLGVTCCELTRAVHLILAFHTAESRNPTWWKLVVPPFSFSLRRGSSKEIEGFEGKKLESLQRKKKKEEEEVSWCKMVGRRTCT